MKKAIKNVLLIALAVVLIMVFVGCNQRGASQQNGSQSGSLDITTIPIIPAAYLGEPYNLMDVILSEQGVSYSATAVVVKAVRDEQTNEYSITRDDIAVTDMTFTPEEVCEVMVTVSAQREKETASKKICVPVIIRAEPLDELLNSTGQYSIADPGISKAINNDSRYIYGENSTTSLHVSFNGTDPHAWGNSFLYLSSKEVQNHFTDKTWKNGVLTFWVYNSSEKPIEFQMRLYDTATDLNIDWSDAEGDHRQWAQPGQWTQIFFSLRKMGVTNRITADQYNEAYVIVKFRYEDYNTTDSYAFDFYVDNLDVVDGSEYPDLDTRYVLSDETLEQGWENMKMDIGWQGVSTEYNYENVQGEGSTCSLKAMFQSDKALTNSFICLSPQEEGTFANLDMTGGKLGAYFKFENMDKRVWVDLVNATWQSSNQVEMSLREVGDGWYYGEVDLEKIQVGTGRNDNIIRIRFHFQGVSKNSVVYMDTCKFEYKEVYKVLESVSADWINMTPDTGSFYYVGNGQFNTSYLKGSNTVRSLKITAPSGEKGKYTLNTGAAVELGEISAVPNMSYGTLGAWFYFGKQQPNAVLVITNDVWHGSNGVDFVFTKDTGDGWYYGELHGSSLVCAEGGSTSKAIRLSFIIPEGYTVYMDNLHWSYGYETELVSVVKPGATVDKVSFKAAEDQTVELGSTAALAALSFDYKIQSGDHFNIALMPNWESYYGYFEFNANGPVDPYEGITCESLENGYVRVTFNLKALTKANGNPGNEIAMLYIRGEWTDANGTIENIVLTADDQQEPEPELPENGFEAGKDKTIIVEKTENVATISLDYKILSGDHFNIALMPNWENYYGYFEFNANGPVDAYEGVTGEILEDGVVRVTFDLTAMTKMFGAPAGGIELLYIRGEWTDANGYIENIQYTIRDDQEPTEPTEPQVTEPEITEPEVTEPEVTLPESHTIAAGTDQTIDLVTTEELATISFIYKLETGTKFNVALLPNWESYFGYFEFGANGAVDAYTGITCEALADGEVRVTFNLAELDKVSGAPSKVIDFLYIRGDWTDANGYIRDIQYTVPGDQEPTEPEVTEPEVTEPEITEPQPTLPESFDFYAGSDLTIDLPGADEVETISFVYKLQRGTKFNVALMPNWESYFGYFEFSPTGAVDAYTGITCEVLENGEVRVIFDLAALDKFSGAPSKAIDFLYIRGAWTDANGYIRDIVCGSGTEEIGPDQVTEGASITANSDATIVLGNTQKLAKITFDYKIESGSRFNVALMPDWFNYFGYFEFDANGAVDPYEGITCEKLDNGYVRVTFLMAELAKTSGTPSAVIDFMYVRGAWTDANGEITNIHLYYDQAKAVTRAASGSVTMATDAEPKHWVEIWLEELIRNFR